MTDSDFHCRAMRVDDARQLVALVHRVYDDTYFDEFYYDIAALQHALNTGRLCSFILLDGCGNIVAHIGVRIPDQHYTAISSLAIVDPAYRGKGLLAQVGMPLYQLCLDKGFSVIHGQAVTVHTYTQQTNLRGGAAVTGIYLNYIPAGQRFLETGQADSEVPTPTVIMVTPVSTPTAGAIYLPDRYSKQALQAFELCHMPREMRSDDGELPQHCVISTQHMFKQRVDYLWMDTVGADIKSCLAAQLETITADQSNAVYLHLPMDQLPLDTSITIARELGFFYAGVLPSYKQRDWLILQAVPGERPDFAPVQLAGDVAPALLDFIIDDYKAG